MKIQGTRQTREHRERPADDVRRPAAPRGEPRERDERAARRPRRRLSARTAPGRRRTGRAVPLSCPAYCSKPRPRSAASGADRGGVADHGQEPREEQPGRDDERREREAAFARVPPLPEPAHREEPRERDPEEERVGRMDGRERERGDGSRCEERGRRPPHRLERERQRSGDEQLSGGGRRERERGERAAVPRGHRDDRDARRGGRRRRHGAPEERPARLVGHEHRERREDGRAVEDDVDGIGTRDLGDEREEAVPEGKRVAGVEPAVRELVRAAEREIAEGEELLDPGEVEEAVAADVPGNVPEEEAEHRSRGEDRGAVRDIAVDSTRAPAAVRGRHRRRRRLHPTPAGERASA